VRAAESGSDRDALGGGGLEDRNAQVGSGNKTGCYRKTPVWEKHNNNVFSPANTGLNR